MATQNSIEQTKQQIRGLVGEIVQLSKSELPTEEYFPGFLERAVSALAAVGGAVWLMEEGRPKLAYQINLSETLLDPESEDTLRHLRLLHQLIQRREPQLVPPLSGPGESDTAGNPTRYLLVVAPIICDGQLEGVVEIFQRPGAQPVTQRGYLRFLVQMSEHAGEWFKNRKLKHFSDRHSLWAQADHFSRLVHGNLDLRETAYTVVNEGRRLIGCDRVAVAIKRGRKCKIEALSGQDTVDDRSNIVATLNQLSTRVVAAGEPLWYEGYSEDLPPQIEEAVEAYVDESYAKTVAVLPLRRPGEGETQETATGEVVSENVEDREIIGALIIEQIETDLPRELLDPRVDLVFEHSTRALSNAMEHRNIFLMPLWRAIGRAGWVMRARTLPKTLAIAAALLAATLLLAFYPADFNLESRGALQPVNKRDVFVDTAGVVVNVLKDHGDPVREGEVVAELRSDELKQQLIDVRGQRNSVGERITFIENFLSKNRASAEETGSLTSELLELRERRNSLERKLELLEEKQRGLKVTSPIDGRVVTWDVQRMLQGRPVQTGQVLLTVANEDSDWEVELYMPERRSNHLLEAQREMGEDLPVTYILASQPDEKFQGEVKSVARAMDMHEEEGYVMRVLVDVEESDLVNPRHNTTVTADVQCGKAPLGYVWFHEAWAWVQTNVLF